MHEPWSLQVIECMSLNHTTSININLVAYVLADCPLVNRNTNAYNEVSFKNANTRTLGKQLKNKHAALSKIPTEVCKRLQTFFTFV